MGWAGGHIGAVWAVLYKCGWLLGAISAHSRGGANTHSGGEIGRRGEMREPTAPSVWRCPPRHHSLPAYCPQPTAKAIWPRCGSNLLRWRFANQAAPACYVASWANRTSGRPGNAHAAGAMTMEHAGCVDNVRWAKRGSAGASKRGAWDSGAREKCHEATKSKRPAVPKGPVCMCVHVRADVRAAGTSQVPWVRWETGHKSQGASCLPCWVGRTDDPTAATGRRAHESARPDGGFQAGAMNCALRLTTGRGEGA